MLFRVMKWSTNFFFGLKYLELYFYGPSIMLPSFLDCTPYSIHITKSNRFPVPRDAEKHSSVTILVNFTNTVNAHLLTFVILP